MFFCYATRSKLQRTAVSASAMKNIFPNHFRLYLHLLWNDNLVQKVFLSVMPFGQTVDTERERERYIYIYIERERERFGKHMCFESCPVHGYTMHILKPQGLAAKIWPNSSRMAQEPEAGTVWTVSQETEKGTGTVGTVFRAVLKQKSPFLEQSHRNRKPEPLELSHARTVTEPNRTGATLFKGSVSLHAHI